MPQTSLSRLVRDDLPQARFPQSDQLSIEPYLYEIVAELSDGEVLAFLGGLALLEDSGEPNGIVRSVISRVIRLIECDAILENWK
jgi:hypothetical protein